MPGNSSITAIVAATKSNGIGLNGGLPWRLPNEMKYFAKITTGDPSTNRRNAVIMGRKTWESIPTKFRPLKDRSNLVISRGALDLSGQASSYTSLESALSASTQKDIHRSFLIGGAQLYNLALQHSPPLVDRILLTRVLTDFECDTFLYDFSSHTDAWRLAAHDELCEWAGWEVPKGEVEEKGVTYRYEMWVRR